mmetsp:Transcript_15157/g.31189  ORF Transcript_15157/g.31189 Transcript_15157/m.31189 type:complete len:510 (+) Transcript_15157:2242-3771(+)
MFEGSHDLFFSQDTLNLTGINQLALCDGLQSVGLLCVATSSQPNFSEGTHSEHFVFLNILASDSGIECPVRKRNGLPKPLDVSDNLFDVGLFQSPTDGVFLDDAGFLADVFAVGLDSLVSEVITGSQKEDFPVFSGDHELALLDDPQGRIVTDLAGLGEFLSLVVFADLEHRRQHVEFGVRQHGLAEDRNRLDESRSGCPSEDAFERSDGRLKGVTVTGKDIDLGHGGHGRRTGVPRHQGTFSKPISRSAENVVKGGVSETNVVHPYLSALDDVEHITLFSLFDDLLSLFVFDGVHDIGKLFNRLAVEVFEQINLRKDFDDAGFAILRGSRQKVTEGPLVDLPEDGVFARDTGGCTRRIVQEREFSEGPTRSARSDGFPVANETDFAGLADVKKVTRVTLFDDHFTLVGNFFLHGVDEHLSFDVGQIRKDEIRSQGHVEKGRLGIRLGMDGGRKVAVEVHDTTPQLGSVFVFLLGFGVPVYLFLTLLDSGLLGVLFFHLILPHLSGCLG